MFGEGSENTGRWSEHDEDDKRHVEEGNEFIIEEALRNKKKRGVKEIKGALKRLTLGILHKELMKRTRAIECRGGKVNKRR